MNWLLLFFHFSKFALLCFGGGYVLIPLLITAFVDEQQIMTLAEFGNLLSIAQVTPGPVGLNTATYVGYVYGGAIGSFAASLGLIFPTVVLGCSAVFSLQKWKQSFLMNGILKGTRLAAVAMILYAVTIFFGMSVFTSAIPWHELGRVFLFQCPEIPDTFRISPTGAVLCACSALLVWKTKIPTTVLILSFAAAGALLAFF